MKALKFSEDTVSTTAPGIIEGLDKYIVGMVQAKRALAEILAKPIIPLFGDVNTPLGVIMIGGQSSIGKSEICRALARLTMGSPDAMTMIKGDDLMQDHYLSTLKGSPPGYIGEGHVSPFASTRLFEPYNKALRDGTLHESVRGRSGFSIVCMDDFEKAHPSIPQAFLTAFSTGTWTLTTGRDITTDQRSSHRHDSVTPIRNTIFVITTNLGEHSLDLEGKTNMGFNPQNINKDPKIGDANFKKFLRKEYSPEFIKRLDYYFREEDMTEDRARTIAGTMIDRWRERIGEATQNKVVVRVERAALVNTLIGSYDPEKGVRELKRVFGARVENVFEKGLPVDFMDNAYESGYKVDVGVNPDGKIAFKIQPLEGVTNQSHPHSKKIKNAPVMPNFREAIQALGLWLQVSDLSKFDPEISMELAGDLQSLTNRLIQLGVSRTDMRAFTRDQIGAYAQTVRNFIDTDNMDLEVEKNFQVERHILEAIFRKAVRIRNSSDIGVLETVMGMLNHLGINEPTQSQMISIGAMLTKFVSKNPGYQWK